MSSANTIDTNFVRYSRAGDAFHYRWAARRCIKLVNPSSKIKQIVIEGSKERTKAGEFNIDVSEYGILDEGKKEEVFYYQLKHSTKRLNKPFNLSDLKSTIVGFAERFNEVSGVKDAARYKFILITNRPVKKRVKECIQNIINGKRSDKRLKNTLERYTALKDSKLKGFCKSIEFNDGEGGYNEQKYSLHAEISEITAGTVDNSIVDNLIALVADQALPDSNGLILKEDVLKRFGVSSERELFPATSEVEDISGHLKREQHNDIINTIKECQEPIIIYAGGGIGKSVLARQIVSSLSGSSHGLVYDCFDSGRYRARSSSRHRHKTAFTQIINEMAVEGFCEPLIPSDQYHDETMMKRFLSSLHTVSQSIRKSDPEALCYVFIDAADNAEMAANEFNEPCFASQILRETIPDGCRIVLLCRPERKGLLKPPSSIQSIELQPFSENETKTNLLNYFPDASYEDILEFHRLSSQNPRVQANALGAGKLTIQELLESLGPSPTTVDEQISDQLKKAVNKIKDQLPEDFQPPIDAICIGLANLPPLVPIHVLAKAADVEEGLIRSFILDIGRPLWIGENTVQFRDEPTESWFRENFSASEDQIKSYVGRLKSLALEIPYVSEALPSLLHSSGSYSELIELALSDDFLPEYSPIDARNIRVYRLRFAFKAALKERDFKDATKLAFRAGEEIAGESRQLELLAQNIDLINPLQSEEKVQELAFRRLLKGTWEGCENIFSASLLSSIKDFKGEARSFLRAANNWLRIYFDERDKKSKEDRYNESLQNEHIVEMAMAYLNIFGVEKLVEFLQSWKPEELVFRLNREVVKRMIDAGRFKTIEKIAQLGRKNPYLILALTQSLSEVGLFPPKSSLVFSLNLLTNKNKRLIKPDEINYFQKNDFTLLSILTFLEACLTRGLDKRDIFKTLKYYFPIRGSVLANSAYQKEIREIFLRQTALRNILSKTSNFDIDQLLPKEWVKDNNNYEKNGFKETVRALLPWYITRAEVLNNKDIDIEKCFERTQLSTIEAMSQRYKDNDHLPSEIAIVQFSILTLHNNSSEAFILEHYRKLENGKYQLKIKDKLRALRTAFRLERLSIIRESLLKSCSEEVSSMNFEESQIKTEFLVEIARAVSIQDNSEASEYFNLAIESVSKFGDEIVMRWQAVADIANCAVSSKLTTKEDTYRFIRCLELVGDYVAREKYLDRNKAVKIATKLHPQSTFASLSRWRDRDVGWFKSQIVALAQECIESKTLSPRVAFSLTAFDFNYGDFEFLELCLENETDPFFRSLIFDLSVNKFRINDFSEKNFWVKIDQLAEKHSLQNSELQEVLKFYEDVDFTTTDNHLTGQERQGESDLNNDDWIKIFQDKNLLSSKGISAAISAFNEYKEYRNHEFFWKNLYQKISVNNGIEFFEALINSDKANKYNVVSALTYIPEDWLQRISIQKAITNLNFLFGQRFASELLNRYTFEYLLKESNSSVIDVEKIREGIIQGLSENSSFEDAGIFFGFVSIIAPILTPDDSLEVLKYSLSRFEIHIEEDYGDGEWDEWLQPPQDIIESFAGFIWAALGSPRTEMRWEAAHCIRLLAEMKCQSVIDSLIEWMQKDTDGAFGRKDFPFYNLHARLYLFIALARVSLEHPELVQNQYSVFEFNALRSTPHLLIQKFSAQIAISIEKKFPGTYDSNIVNQLEQVGESPFPIRTDLDYGETVDGYWVSDVEFEQTIELYLEYDFDNYWISPLSRVFSIPNDQVLNLARHTLLKEFTFDAKEGMIIDPRKNFWRNKDYGKETRNYKSSYPDTDSYRFYLSYHVMLRVAQELLERMPVTSKSEWDDDPLEDWLKRHILTRNDGKWLSDRRDPTPIKKREWITKKNANSWSKKINPNDFLNGIFINSYNSSWLNIYGDWSEGNGIKSENYRITSALVSSNTSSSLLNALATCSDPYDFKLPGYREDRFEIDTDPFKLYGWILDYNIDKGIDEADPYSAKIYYPPFEIGESIVDKLDLTSDADKRYWYINGESEPVLACKIWSDFNAYKNEGPTVEGKRLSASKFFLQRLCEKMDSDLVIEVQIRRSVYKSYGNEEQEFEKGPKSKIFIFSKDGKIRDERTNYQFRKNDC